jgi:hypothetical protein
MTEFQNDVTAIREAFEETEKRVLKLSDTLLDMIVTNCKDWDDMDEEQTMKFLKNAETEAAKVSVTDPGITALIGKMDDQFHAQVAHDVKAIVDSKNTAISMYSQFKRIYTLDEMNAFPVPNTDKDDVIGNQKPDKIKTKDQTGKEVTTVWTNDFVSAMPEGKASEATIDEVKKERASPGSTSLKGRSKKDLAAILSAATQERNALRSMVKRSIALHHALQSIEELPKVGLSWQKPAHSDKLTLVPEHFGEGDMGSRPIKVTTGPKPFWLYPTDDPSDGREFSVTQLINFDVPAARAAGGSMADLVATIGKGSDDNGGDTDGDGTDLPIDAAQAVFSQSINWLSKKENLANLRRTLADKKNPDRKDWVENIGDLFHLLSPEYEKIKMAYQAIKADKLDEGEEEATKRVA